MNTPEAPVDDWDESNLPAHDDARAGNGINLLDILIVAARHKLLIAAATLGAAALSVIYTLMLPNIYTGNAKVLPPQSSQSAASAVLGQLSGLAGMAGASSSATKNSDLYVGMLRSRTIADAIIQRFDLRTLYGSESMVLTRNALAAKTSIAAGKDGLITIEYDDVSPQRAAAITNAYWEELDKLTQSLAVTEPAQRRLFFERQLERAKENLVNAQVAARAALQKGGVAMVDEQGKSMIESIAALRAQITLKEVQINSMGFANEQNPELVQARGELSALRQQLRKLEGSGLAGAAPGITQEAGQGLKNLALVRDVKYHEALFELFAKQFEVAKIDEAKESGIVQVVDRAIPPDRKSKPRRAPVVIVATLVGAFLGLLFAFLLEMRGRLQRDPAHRARLQDLRRHLSFRGSRFDAR